MNDNEILTDSYTSVNRLTAAAGILLAALVRGPRTWHELASLGFDRTAALAAVGELVDAGEHRVRVGPILLELEDDGQIPGAATIDGEGRA